MKNLGELLERWDS